MKRYWDDNFGWGEIVMESDNYIIVRFDSDPWELHQIPKP